jgi:hypothetical protein
MSALDDHFGTKAVGDMTNYSAEGPNRLVSDPANKRSSYTESSQLTTKSIRTAFPRCEERLRPYLDAFLAEVRKITGDDYTPPHVYAVKWVAGARDLAQVLPEPRVAEFMPWAFAKHMQTFPDGRPDSPRSLLYLVERFKPNALRNWDSILCSECYQSPCVCEESET